MSCNDVLERLDAYLDGDLDQERAHGVRGHLEHCAGCREERDRALALAARMAEMPREVDPPRDLWPEVRDRIRPGRPASVPRSRGTTWQGWAAAAAAGSLALLAWWGFGAGSGGPTTVGGTSHPEAVRAVEESDDAFEAQFRLTRDTLLADLESRKGDLDAETVEVVLENLRTMERAAEEIRLALRDHPGNPALQRLLLASYRKQVGLLHSMNRIPAKI